jgi:hypothetical protein
LVSQVSMRFQGVLSLQGPGGCRHSPTARADASRLRTLRSMPPYWFFLGGGARVRGAAWGNADRLPGGATAPDVATQVDMAARARPLPARCLVDGQYCSPAPGLWHHGAIRHVERLPGQGARAGCARYGLSRPTTRVAGSSARGGPPARSASEASRGPFRMCTVQYSKSSGSCRTHNPEVGRRSYTLSTSVPTTVHLTAALYRAS